MTIKELSQLHYLNREIEADKMHLAELETAASSVTPKITGLPHIAGISDKTGLAAEIADLRTIIESKLKLTIATYNRIHRFAASLDDSLVRQAITLKYANCLPWHQVARSIGRDPRTGKHLSGDALRMRVERYLQNKF